MAAIRKYPFIRHYLGGSSDFTVHLAGGKLRHQGVGQAFWFSPANTVISEVPATDQEYTAILHALTADQQDVAVQTTLTYRFGDPVIASQRLDFGLFPTRKNMASGAEQARMLVGNSAQAIVVDVVASMTLTQLLRDGIATLRDRMGASLPEDQRLFATGIQVIGTKVLSLRPDPDTERALATPVREQLQAEADRATYERRALAVEREQTIAENELASEIELATRREQLMIQDGANKRRAAEEAAAAGMIDAQAEAEQLQVQARAQAEEMELIGQAQAASEAALMKVYEAVGHQVLTAMAMKEAAANLPAVGNLTITPDLLTTALTALAGNGGTVAAPRER